MAEMIPDRLPNNASAGEKKVFEFLQNLPDEAIVYYEPVIGNRYPDFVVILPEIGLLIIEVKGWYPKHIASANQQDVVVTASGRPEVHKHPIRQAREYQFKLMDLARQHPDTSKLLHNGGQHEGRFVFPFGHLVILNNCTRDKLDEKSLSELFPVSRVIARNELDAFQGLDGARLTERLKGFFDPIWPINPMTEDQISVLRAVIHPEIVISSTREEESDSEQDLRVLDLRQERNARSIGEGHRVIYGVAGSGKTVILISRARVLAQELSKRCLILCYNVALAEEFQRVFADAPNIDCMHFHAWGGKHGVAFRREEEEENYGLRLLEKLDQSAGIYDAVLIDEAQDFARSWLECAKAALREPDDGDLLIVGDGSQKLYRRRRFSWRDAGIQAQGRTINKRFDLDRNYRNTFEVLKLAAQFVQVSETDDPELSLPTLAPDLDSVARHGPVPEIYFSNSLDEELGSIEAKISSLLDSGLQHRDIAILYRANTKGWVAKLARRLAESHPVFWRQGRQSAYQNLSGIRLTTMHSAKGLQWPVVLIARADALPFIPDDVTDPVEAEALERGLMYVAMTRAEQQLFFTASSKTGFAAEVADLLT